MGGGCSGSSSRLGSSNGGVGVYRRTLLWEIPSTSTTAAMPHFADRALIISHPALSLRIPYLSNLVRSDRRLSTFTDMIAKVHLTDLVAIKTVDLHQSLNRFCLLRVALRFLNLTGRGSSCFYIFCICISVNQYNFFIRRSLQFL